MCVFFPLRKFEKYLVAKFAGKCATFCNATITQFLQKNMHKQSKKMITQQIFQMFPLFCVEIFAFTKNITKNPLRKQTKTMDPI